MEKMTEITLAWELFQQGVPKAHIAKHLDRNRETVILWLQAIEVKGLSAFLEQQATANKKPRLARQVRMSTKQLVWAIREREGGCCGQKIAYFLEKEHQIKLSVPKIYEVLAEKYTLRSKWAKNQKRGQVPEAEAPRQKPRPRARSRGPAPEAEAPRQKPRPRARCCRWTPCISARCLPSPP